MNSTIDDTNQVETLLLSWPKRIVEDKTKLLERLTNLNSEINNIRVSIGTLVRFYERFPNVRAAIRDRDSEGVFNRLNQAMNSFITEVAQLPPELPQNFENSLRPFAGEVKLASTTLAKWATDTRLFSEAQVRDLSTAK